MIIIPNEHDEFLRAEEVARMLGYAKASFWKFAARTPDFPKRIHLTSQAVRWSRDEVTTWMAQKRTTQA